MALIIWRREYSVGVDRLDADHIIIASLINHLDDAKQSGQDEYAAGRILAVLIEHAHAHFRREEDLMRAWGYPELERHAREHHMVEEQLEELHAEYGRTPDPAVSREIMELLTYWLIEHILKVDRRYKDFLDERRD